MDDPHSRFRFAPFVLDAARRTLLTEDGRPVALRPKSFDLLCCLLRHAGRLVTKQRAFDTAWPGLAVSDESLARCISDIRAALGDREQRLIKTVPGRGYILTTQVGTEPDGEGPAPAAPTGFAPPTNHPSIAVLPFAGPHAGEAEAGKHAFLAEALAEDITAALCRLGGVGVVAGHALSAYRGIVPDPREAGRDLGVRYLVQGSVRGFGGRVRVAAHLLDAATAGQIWAGQYERTLDDLFAIRDKITLGIVGQIGTELLVAEYARSRRKPPHSLDAWECVVRALFHSSRQSEEATRAAIALLDRALAADPDYAQALGMKAWILVFRAFQGWDDMGDALASATALIAHAMAVDNAELWPLLAQGMVGFATRDNALSMAALTRALALSPSSVNAHGLLALAHAFGGRAEEARRSIARAMRLSPRDTYLSDFELYNAFIHFTEARYDLGLQLARQAHGRRPGHPYPMLLAAACAGHCGEVATGAAILAALRRALPVVSSDWVEATSPYVLPEDRARLIEGLVRVGL